MDEFIFLASSIQSDTGCRVLKAFHDLRLRRVSLQVCGCTDKDSPHQHINHAKNEITVVFGWFCKKCVHELETLLAVTAPEILSGTVGASQSSYPPPIQREIEFRDAIAEFEDGQTINLLPFSIQKTFVTIGQFSSFASETGYQTSSELHGQYGDETYKQGPTIDPIKPSDRANLPACSLSFLDAVAYCDWAKVRLPTEAELLAASLIDKRLMGPRERSSFLFGPDGRFLSSRFPNALDDLRPQWVSGLSPPGYAIVRSGPYLVRELDWKTQKYRHEWPVDAYDLMCGFRTCRNIDQ
jgi:hypothetical protein